MVFQMDVFLRIIELTFEILTSVHMSSPNRAKEFLKFIFDTRNETLNMRSVNQTAPFEGTDIILSFS